MSKTASDMIGQLFGARNSTTGPAAIKQSGEAALKSLGDLLNSQLNGTFLFAGINTDVKPVAEYFSTPTSTPRQAVENTFTAYFGFPQSDPQAKQITGAQMQAFLDTDFADLFSAANWAGTWSSASDQNIKSRISTNELIDTSANANDQAFRRLSSAYTMIADLNVQGLSQTAFQSVVDTATKVIGGAVKDITELQAALGVSQARISDANDRMSIQADLIDKHINLLEGVDPYEATTRVNALMTQIETAYSMTSRIQQLSILKYL
jgi:flagellar hook-associated protein 3 FlgL